LLLAGCASGPGAAQYAADGPLATAAEAMPRDAVPTTLWGAYLSGRVAEEQHDIPAALAFFSDALAHDPTDPELKSHVFLLAVSEGDFDIAGPLGAELAAADPDSALANLVTTVELARAGKPADALDHAKRLPDVSLYHFVGRLARAWLMLDDHAKPADAVGALDGLESANSLEPLKSLHTALIEDLGGDNPAAEIEYEQALSGGHPPLRMVQLAGNFFERIGKRDRAATLYATYAVDSFDNTLTPHVAPEGTVPARLIPTARDGLAEALFDMASLVNQADSPDVALLNIRLALRLKPDFPLGRLELGDVLEASHRLGDALALYQSFDPASPYGWTARLRAAAVEIDQGNEAAAETALTTMAAERPNAPEPMIELGDALRRREQYKQAAEAYGAALTRAGSNPPPRYWSLYFTRGSAYERAGDWPPAEADLRKSLLLQPDQPEVLNYLGYALVDRNEHLAEATSLIKRAVDLKPNDGFIVDSLGWAYFRQGNFRAAQATLEHAVELKPGDAAINDHLGDAYWQSGRRDDAKLQWRRALSLNPDADLAKAIQAKLDHPPHVQPAARRGS